MRANDHKREAFLHELERLDNLEGECGIPIKDFEKREGIWLELTGSIQMEEISWRQKSRVRCIKEGNKNTKKFHKIANHHRRCNYVKELEVNGQVVRGHESFEREG